MVVWERAVRDAAGSSTPCESLLALFNDARLRIDRRLAALGATSESAAAGEGKEAANPGRLPGRRGNAPEALGLKACRACGRSLSAAFREAQSGADHASAETVYRSLRAFEKHLWLLDPLQAR